MEALIDTNVQIYRTLYDQWDKNKCDDIFDNYKPVVTDLVLMEFRKTAIFSLDLLIILINDIIEAKGDDYLMFRLSDIMKSLANNRKRYIPPRKLNLMLMVLGYFLDKPYLLEAHTLKSFTRELKFWGEELEEFTFYLFRIDGKLEDIREKEQFWTIFNCPLSECENAYFCKKRHYSCDASAIFKSDCFTKIVRVISNNGNSSPYGSLKDVFKKIVDDALSDKQSLGSNCFKIADIFHVYVCLFYGLCMITGDKECHKLIKDLTLPSVLYKQNENCFEE